MTARRECEEGRQEGGEVASQRKASERGGEAARQRGSEAERLRGREAARPRSRGMPLHRQIPERAPALAARSGGGGDFRSMLDALNDWI